MGKVKLLLLKSFITPSTGTDLCITAIATQLIGIFLRKFEVPSRGSITQNKSPSSSEIPDS